MKKLFIILFIVTTIAGCSIQSPTNDQGKGNDSPPVEQPANEELNKKEPELTLDHAKIVSLLSQLKNTLFPEMKDLKVTNAKTKDELYELLQQIMNEHIANLYINSFYTEKRDGLYLNDKRLLSLINIPSDFQSIKVSDTQYRVKIDNKNEMLGEYSIDFKLVKINENDWFVVDILIKSEKENIYFNHFANTKSTLVLVNKDNSLPNGYVPSNLTEVKVPFSFTGKSEKKQLREEAAKHLEEMFRKASQEGITLYAVSGYRSYSTQEAIFAYNVKRYGSFEEANKISAQPGQSEHQTGLVMDISSDDVNYQLIEEFANTPAGKWVKENAHKFGFIIRYPKDKVDITGYSYEPWHLRYVGEVAATEIAAKNFTFEEYYEAHK